MEERKGGEEEEKRERGSQRWSERDLDSGECHTGVRRENQVAGEQGSGPPQDIVQEREDGE